MYCSSYSNTRGVTTLSPSRNLVPRFTMKERFIRNQRMVIESVPWFERHEGRRDHFLNSQVRIMPTIGEILQTKISFNVGSTLTPLLGKKDEGSVSIPLVKPQGQGSKITKTSRVVLGQSNRHTSHLKSQQTD
jgi:hypothetical protein